MVDLFGSAQEIENHFNSITNHEIVKLIFSLLTDSSLKKVQKNHC